MKKPAEQQDKKIILIKIGVNKETVLQIRELQRKDRNIMKIDESNERNVKKKLLKVIVELAKNILIHI